MTIKIFTYENPYTLTDENYWDLISQSPWICASQVMVNAFQSLFTSVRDSCLYSTAERLCKGFFPEWLDPITSLKLYSSIDGQIKKSIYNVIPENNKMAEYAESSFRKNQKEVLTSIRTLFDFNYPCDIVNSELSLDQRILVDLFRNIKLSGKYNEIFPENIPEDKINGYLSLVFNDHEIGGDFFNNLSNDRIVFVGVHQFSPLLARLFFELAKYKEVIVLFNFRRDYPEIYKTWENVYSPVNSETVYSNKSHSFNSSSESIQLSKTLHQIFSGRRFKTDRNSQVSIIEFDTEADFAEYVAKSYQSAKSLASARNIKNPLSLMKEKFYSANTHVNEILKIYFPDQFEERSFMDYPIGKFIFGLTRIWNPELNKIEITDWDDVREILASQIIDQNKEPGLLTIFNHVFPYIESAINFEELIDRLNDLEDSLDSSDSFDHHISYLNVDLEELEILISGFNDLKEISNQFFLDFQNNKSNFRRFYRELNNFLDYKFSDHTELEDEFSEFLKRINRRFEKIKYLDTHGSFTCLQSTINEYLQLDETEQTRSKWIVKGFKQIDGDILFNSDKNRNTVYHFACLSDEEMTSQNQPDFPWPLSEQFFLSQKNSEFRKAINLYIASVNERTNYNRYAFLFGLIFNPGSLQLSYIKQTNSKSNELYFPLLLLKTRIEPWKNKFIFSRFPKEEYEVPYKEELYSFSESDLYLYKTCQFRFLIESLIRNRTEYSDSYLIKKFIESFLENKVRSENEGDRLWPDFLYEELNNNLEEVIDDLPILNQSERLDLVRNVFNKLKKLSKYPEWTPLEEKAALQRNLFLSNFDKKKIQNLINDGTPMNDCLTEDNLGDFHKYKKEQSIACNLCPVQSICLHRRVSE